VRTTSIPKKLNLFDQPHRVDNALRVGTFFRNNPHPMSQLFNLCGSSYLHVLGIANPTKEANPLNSYKLLAYTEPATPFPQISCPKDHGTTVQLILFERPSPTRMQYMSLSSISLALGDDALGQDLAPNFTDADGMETADERAQKARLIKKLQLHSVIKHSPSQKEKMLPTILSQINCSSELACLLSSNVHLIGTRQKRSLSVGERVVESASSLWDHVFVAAWHLITVWVYPLLKRAFVIGLICHRVVAEAILCVLEWRPRPESMALKDISATAQQVDIRLQQFCYWPIQYLTLRKRKDDWESITERHPDYIRFYNSLWLVANDVIIGIALGSYIIDNADWVAYQINEILIGWTVEGLRDMISWLMDWPAGLKLNNELAVFLGDLFLWVIDYWAGKLILSNDRYRITEIYRLCWQSPTLLASNHLLYRFLCLCWR